MGFGQGWVSWISFCIKTTRFSVLANGEPADYFPPERDPLSSFLFTIAIAGLDCLTRVASNNNWIRGVCVKNRAEENLKLTHLTTC